MHEQAFAWSIPRPIYGSLFPRPCHILLSGAASMKDVDVGEPHRNTKSDATKENANTRLRLKVAIRVTVEVWEF